MTRDYGYPGRLVRITAGAELYTLELDLGFRITKTEDVGLYASLSDADLKAIRAKAQAVHIFAGFWFMDAARHGGKWPLIVETSPRAYRTWDALIFRKDTEEELSDAIRVYLKGLG